MSDMLFFFIIVKEEIVLNVKNKQVSTNLEMSVKLFKHIW